jgi:hypothetical protein
MIKGKEFKSKERIIFELDVAIDRLEAVLMELVFQLENIRDKQSDLKNERNRGGY